LQFIDGECRKVGGEIEVGMSMMTSSEGLLLSLASGPPIPKPTTESTHGAFEANQPKTLTNYVNYSVPAKK